MMVLKSILRYLDELLKDTGDDRYCRTPRIDIVMERLITQPEGGNAGNMPCIPGYTTRGCLRERGAWKQPWIIKENVSGTDYVLKEFNPSSTAFSQYGIRKQSAGWDSDLMLKMELGYGNLPDSQHIIKPIVITAPGNGGDKRYLLERFGGISLEEYRGRGVIDNAELASIILQMASALSILHTKGGTNSTGGVHGDALPKNWIIDKNGNVALTDFGLGFMGSLPLGKFGDASYRDPAANNEQATPSHKNDLHSFGETIYFLLTGKYVHQDEVAEEGEAYLEKLANSPDLWQGTIDKKVEELNAPGWVKAVVKKCLYPTFSSNGKSRLKDGLELEDEIRQQYDRFLSNRPRRRLKRIASYTSAIVGTAALAFTLFSNSNEISSWKERALASYRSGNYRETSKQIQSYEASLYGDPSLAADIGRIGGWFEMMKKQGITDRATVRAAILNPDVTAAAIIESDSRTDYKDIRERIRQMDAELASAIDAYSCRPSGIHYDQSETEGNALHTWEQAKQNYQANRRQQAIALATERTIQEDWLRWDSMDELQRTDRINITLKRMNLGEYLVTVPDAIALECATNSLYRLNGSYGMNHIPDKIKNRQMAEYLTSFGHKELAFRTFGNCMKR